MKTFLVPAIALMAIVYQPSAQAQALGPGAVKIEKIEPAVIKTPEYSVNGGPQKRSVIGSWLEIEVEFDLADAPCRRAIVAQQYRRLGAIGSGRRHG